MQLVFLLTLTNYNPIMKTIHIVLVVLFFILAQSKPNLYIGTGGFGFGCGSNSPAAQVPYSFVRIGPDTTPMIGKLYKKFQHYGGYHSTDHAIKAFSHMHLVGAGVIDMGIIGVFPMIGDNAKVPSYAEDRITAMSKEDEIAEPGYYSTLLQQEKIKVELTSSQRCAAHRYTYFNRKNKPLDIQVMTSYLLEKSSPRFSMTRICGKNCIEGSVKITGGFGGRFGGYTIHFHMEANNTFDEGLEIFLYKNEQHTIANQVEGNHTGAVIRSKSNIIQLYVGISYISIENAKMNYEIEIKGKSFQQVHKEAQEAWTKELKRFDIVAYSQADQTKIDTAIYRSLLSPTIFQDANGQYLSFRNDGSVQTKLNSMTHVYTDMSIWDVHRTQFPWILFQDPHRFADIAMSIVLINREGGYMPKWPFAQGPTGCMIGAHANTVLADWIIKQAYKNKEKYNISEILSYMLRNANTNTPHDSRSTIQQYKKLGYIPFDKKSRDACSETLEYSYNDFGISQVAGLIPGYQQTQKQFIRRSKFYKNLFNNQTKFFQPKFSNGTFKKISLFEKVNIFSNFYVEGDAWHYRFYAPHDAAGLIQLFGGEIQFVRQLNKFFSRSPSWQSFWLPNPYYWPGNEHDLFSVWLFQFANRPDLTEFYSRQILDTAYGVNGNGLPGNDDYATMSAWLIFASLGFYPLPSTETYILGSPLIKYARISRRMSQKEIVQFIVRANNNSKDNVYVKRIEVNRQERKKRFIQHNELGKDSTLQFWMDSKKYGQTNEYQ